MITTQNMPRNLPQKLEWSTIFSSISTNFTATFAASALNLSIPAIAERFDIGAEYTGWIITSYLLGTLVFLTFFGKLADAYGRKRIFTSGILLFSISSLACAFAPSIIVMIALRLVQGVAGAMIFSTNIAIMVNSQPPQKRGMALGFAVAAIYIGLSAGPPVGGFLNKSFGYQSIFISAAILGAIALTVACTLVPDDTKVHIFRRRRGDAPVVEGAAGPQAQGGQAGGTKRFAGINICDNIIYIIGISMLMFGISLLAGHKWALAVLLAGVALIVLFVFLELRSSNPVVNIHLLATNRNYLFSNIATLLNYCFVSTIVYYLSIYLQIVRGFNSAIAGAILIFQPVLQAIVSPFAGRLSDRVSPFKVATFGMVLCGIGLTALCFLGEQTHIVLILVSLAIIGAGVGFFSSPNTNAIMSCVEKADYSKATSFSETMRTFGQTSGLSIATAVITLWTGNTALNEAPHIALSNATRTGFIIFVAFCVFGIFCSMQRKSAPKPAG